MTSIEIGVIKIEKCLLIYISVWCQISGRQKTLNYLINIGHKSGAWQLSTLRYYTQTLNQTHETFKYLRKCIDWNSIRSWFWHIFCLKIRFDKLFVGRNMTYMAPLPAYFYRHVQINIFENKNYVYSDIFTHVSFYLHHSWGIVATDANAVIFSIQSSRHMLCVYSCHCMDQAFKRKAIYRYHISACLYLWTGF